MGLKVTYVQATYQNAEVKNFFTEEAALAWLWQKSNYPHEPYIGGDNPYTPGQIVVSLDNFSRAHFVGQILTIILEIE